MLFPTRWKIHLKRQKSWVMMNLWGFMCHSKLADWCVQLSYSLISILMLPFELKMKQLKVTKSLFWIASGPFGFAKAQFCGSYFEKSCLANLKVHRLYFEMGFIPQIDFALLFSTPSGDVLTKIAKPKDFLKANLFSGSYDFQFSSGECFLITTGLAGGELKKILLL